VGCVLVNKKGALGESGGLGDQGMKGSTSLPGSDMVAGVLVGSVPATRDVKPDTDSNAHATNSPSPPPASTTADAVMAPSTRSLAHLVASPPLLPPAPPSRSLGASLQPSEMPAASVSRSEPPPAPRTESTIGDPSRAPSLPRSTSVPLPSSTHHPAPQSFPDQCEDVKRSVASPLPQPEQPTHPCLPTPTSTPAMEAAGTISGCREASSSTLAKALFSEDGDLSDFPSVKSSAGNEDTAIHRHATAKRPRAASSLAATTPSKRRRKSAVKPKAVKPKAVKRKAATSNEGSHRPRPAQSSNRSKKKEPDDMSIGSGDGSTSEEGDGSNNEDEVMGGNGDEFGGSEKAAGPPHQTSVEKGKAAIHKAPSSSTPAAIRYLRQDIPVTYKPLGKPFEEDELLELDWFAPTPLNAPQGKPSKKGKTKLMAPVSGVSPPVSQMPPTRCWHSFSALWMTLNPELEALGDVELSDGVFCFPFNNTQVIKCFSSLNAFLIRQIIGKARCRLSTSRQGPSKHVYPFITFIF
jgi:hypothetical protein